MMVALTMVDCSDPDNRVQARYELDRAETFKSSLEMSAHLCMWAQKWGRPLIEYADSAPTLDEEEGPLAKAYQDATDAENERDDLQAAVNTAIKKLESLLDHGVIEETHEACGEIDGLIATLQDA